MSTHTARRMPFIPTQAVLFDFDGVLADTENVHVAAWQRTLAALGWIESDEACSRAAIIDDRKFLREVFERRGVVGGDVDGWVRRKQDLTARLLADAPRLYPGVAPLIDQLRGKVRLAVVSSAWRANIEIVLGSAGILDAFELIVAKEDVAEPKPQPDGYIRAVKKMKIDPKRSYALEDSAIGMVAARAARLRIGIVGHGQERYTWVGGITPFFSDFDDIPSIIEALKIPD